MSDNTLFLRLAGPMQSWGTSSRFQLRRTDAYPSKSGVLGLLLCAKGVCREESPSELKALVSLSMGVRVDRAGTLEWDYHTAGAKIGIRSADGKIKKTASTGEYETLLSHRQYLFDASFLVALHGDGGTIRACARALDDPVWPVFLGRKCCVPAEPVFVGTDAFVTVANALAKVPWRPRINAIDRNDRSATRTLDTFIEHPPGSTPPADARLVHDVPRVFGYYDHIARWVVATQVTVPVGGPLHPPRASREWTDPYGPAWDALRRARLDLDNDLCVFCKSPAVEMHHLDYEDVRPETLRSLCQICHSACTMLEYGHDMRRRRVDPLDSAHRPALLRQIERIIKESRPGRRRELLESGRGAGATFFDDVPDSRVREGG
ncbi:MAG: type I-E CRISPR-associated protein Cas5/CasD [Tepidisphaeraceae bacterium]